MKACLLVVIVYLLSLALPKMPSPVVALFWVAFTLVSMLGCFTRWLFVKCTSSLYPVGSIAAKFNGGRTISIIVSFCLSAVCMASLLLEAPKWDAAEKVLLFWRLCSIRLLNVSWGALLNVNLSQLTKLRQRFVGAASSLRYFYALVMRYGCFMA